MGFLYIKSSYFIMHSKQTHACFYIYIYFCHGEIADKKK